MLIQDSSKHKPVAEILVEGELSPFEHEALYKLLKKHFKSYCVLHLLERDWAIQPITILDGD